MHRQSIIYIVVAIVAVLLVVGLVMTKNPAHLKTAPGVAPAPQTGSAVGSPSNSVEPCVPSTPTDAASTTNTATTTEGTTPDGRPTGAFVGQPCTAGDGATGTSGTTAQGTNGSGTTSWRQGGTSGSGQTTGPNSGR
jgi:hypothetical protein